ncbi:MAG: YqhA family protein, partial [Streptosporangiaceae bacterium]
SPHRAADRAGLTEQRGEMREPRKDPVPERAVTPLEAVVERALASSVRLVVIPVAFLVLAALGAFVYGAAVFIDAIIQIGRHPFPVGHQVGLFLLDIDLFLIGATLLLAAIGLYELFVREITLGEAAQMPRWLEMHDLNDLKARIIAMIVLVLAVGFAELALDATHGLFVLEIGGGIAVVIAALTAFLRLTSHAGD